MACRHFSCSSIHGRSADVLSESKSGRENGLRGSPERYNEPPTMYGSLFSPGISLAPNQHGLRTNVADFHKAFIET